MRLVVWMLLWGCALLIPAQAWGQGRAPAPVRNRPVARPIPRPSPRLESVVFIAPRNVALQARAVAGVIRAQLRDMKVTFVLAWVDRLAADMPRQLAMAKRVAKARHALVVVWCDFASGTKLHLYYALPGRNRVLVRSVNQAASAQGRAETMGAIVRGGVEAMLSIRRITRPRVAPPVVGPPPPSPPPAAGVRSVSGGLAFGYGLGGYATDGPAVTHSGRLALALLFGRRWSIHLAYGVTPDIRASNDAGDASVILHRHGLRLGGGHRWWWGRLFLGLEGSFLLDLLDRRHETSGLLEPEADAMDVNLGLEAVLRVGYQLTPWLVVYTGAGATLMLRNRDYLVDGVSEPVLRPWPVQPQWVLGLEVSVF